jgi:hypothetical protein
METTVMQYRIPLFELNSDENEETAVIETLRSKRISMGPKTAELEERLNEMLSCRFSTRGDQLYSCPSPGIAASGDQTGSGKYHSGVLLASLGILPGLRQSLLLDNPQTVTNKKYLHS